MSPSPTPNLLPSTPRSGSASKRSSSHHETSQIRVVPYSPPRISEDGSAPPSRPISYIDTRNTSIPPSSPASLPNIDVYDWDTISLSAKRSESSLRRVPVETYRRPGFSGDSDNESVNAPSEGSRPTSRRQPRKVINVSVHSDGTFSLKVASGSASSRNDSFQSHSLSYTTPSSSYGRYSSTSFLEDWPSSPLTPLPEQPHSSQASVQSSSTDIVKASRGRISAKGKQLASSTQPTRWKRWSSQLTFPEQPSTNDPHPASLATKASFTSSNAESFVSSDSTISEKTNYKIYSQSSPVGLALADDSTADYGFDSLPPSSSHSNLELLGESASDGSIEGPQRSESGDSGANYVVHGGSSPSATSLITTKSQRVRSEYSRESLVVPPLRAVKRRSLTKISLTHSSSRDSLRSLTSLSNFVTQESTRSLFAGAAALHIPRGLSKHHSVDAASGLSVGSRVSPSTLSYPYHQSWSPHLSTVASETECGSNPPSRSLSIFASSWRRNSGRPSASGRRTLSLSSAPCEEESMLDVSAPVESYLNYPQPVHHRTGMREPTFGNPFPIRHHDEDGDGLADLAELHHRPSRTRLVNYLSHYASNQSLQSNRTASLRSSLPTWARLYYGSGEPRSLVPQPSIDSIMTVANEHRCSTGIYDQSPSSEALVTNIYNPRRRPRDTGRRASSHHSGRRISGTGSMDIVAAPVINILRTLKKKTSSVWSPHLYQDKRLSSYSLWDPPPVMWSAEKGLTGRRNLQIMLFFMGFLFPFAWIIASFLPLPTDPQLSNMERLQSTSHLDLRKEASLQVQTVQKARYHGAKWWRALNRGMSIIGGLLIIAAISLTVVGVKQQWIS